QPDEPARQRSCGPREGMREANVGGETPESENISRKHGWPYHREGDGRQIAMQAIMSRLGNLVGRIRTTSRSIARFKCRAPYFMSVAFGQQERVHRISRAKHKWL